MVFRSVDGEAQTTWQAGTVAIRVFAPDGAAVRHRLSDVAFAKDVPSRRYVTQIGGDPTLPFRIHGIKNKIAARIWIDRDPRD